jgi:hypothetical protein
VETWDAAPWRYRVADGAVLSPEEGLPDPALDRRADRLYTAAKIGMSSWIAGSVVVVVGLLGVRGHDSWGGSVTWAGFGFIAVCSVPGFLLNRARLRIRETTGYPVPGELEKTVRAAHRAHQLLESVFASVRPPWYRLRRFWQFRRNTRQVWSYLVHYLEEAERARRHGDHERWAKHCGKITMYTGQLSTTCLTLLGDQPASPTQDKG